LTLDDLEGHCRSVRSAILAIAGFLVLCVCFCVRYGKDRHAVDEQDL